MAFDQYTKLMELQQAKKSKLAGLQDKKANITGIYDADSIGVEGLGSLRLTPDNGQRYDAIETPKPGQDYLAGKSQHAVNTQMEATARFLNKPIDQVTEHDMIGYANWQTAKQAANLIGETEWEPTFHPTGEALNLSGHYTDEYGNYTNIPLNIPTTLREQGADRYGRPMASIIDVEGNNQTNMVASDPRQNAFAPDRKEITLGSFGSDLPPTAPEYNLRNTVMGIGAGGIRLGAGIADAAATYAVKGVDALATKMGKPDFISGETVKQASTMFDSYKEHANEIVGYNPEYTQYKVDKALEQFEKGEVFKGFVSMMQGGVDVAAESIPYMVALISGWGMAAVIGSEVNDSIEEVTANNNGQAPNAVTTARIIALDTVKVMLERLPWMAAVKGKSASVEGIKKLLDSVPNSQKKAFAKEFSKKVGVVGLNIIEEGAQEASQYVIDYLNREYGTENDKGFNLEEFKKAIIAGGGAGGAMGTLGQVGRVRDVAKAMGDAKVEASLDETYKTEVREPLKQEVATAVDKGLTKSTLDAIDAAILKVEANGDMVQANAFKEARKKVVRTLQAQELAEGNVEVLGNEPDTVDYINGILSEVPVKELNNPTLQKNIELIAKVNGVSTDTVANIYKDHKVVEREAVWGPKGYKTYERQLNQLKKDEAKYGEEIALVTSRLVNFKQTQEKKIGAIKAAMDRAVAKIESGTMDDTFELVPEVKGQTGKPFKVHVDKTKKGYDAIHPATSMVLARAQNTVSEINRIMKEQGIVKAEAEPEVSVTVPEVEPVNTEIPKAKENPTVKKPVKVEEKEAEGTVEADVSINLDEVSTKPTTGYADVLAKIRQAYMSGDKARIKVANVMTKRLKDISAKFKDEAKTLLQEAVSGTKLKAKVGGMFSFDAASRVLGKDNPTVKELSTIKRATKDTLPKVVNMDYWAKQFGEGHILNDIKSNEFVMDRVIEGMSRAYIEFTSNDLASLDYLEERDVQGLLGVSETTYIPWRHIAKAREFGKGRRAVAAGLGADIVRYAGIDVDEKTVPTKEQAEMEAVFGAMLLDIMEARGLVEITEIPKDVVNEIYDDLEGTDGMVADYGIPTVKPAANVESKIKEAKEVSAQLMEIAPLLNDRVRGIRLDKLEETDFSIRRREELADVSEEKQAKLLEITNQEYEFNVEVIEALDAMNNAGVLAGVLGKKDNSNVRPDTAASIESANNRVTRSITNLLDIYKQVGKDRGFYFDWFLSSNGRNFIDSNTLNPQNDKLHRFAVNRKGDTVTVDSEDLRTVFKLATIQAFDGLGEAIELEDGTRIKDLGSIDKQSLEKSLVEFDKIRVRKDIVAAMEAVKAKDWTNPDLVKVLSKADHPSHALMALIELQKYDDTKPFTTNLTLEADAVTSGVILGLLSMPVMDMDKLQSYLELGGVWLGGTSAKSFGEFIESTNDIYKKGAVSVDSRVDDEIKATLKWIVPELAINGQATKDGRGFMKSPLMVFNYGAGNRSIKSAIARGIVDEYLDKLDSANGDVKTWKEFWDNYIATIDMAIKLEKGKPEPSTRVLKKLAKFKAVNKRTAWQALRTTEIGRSPDLRMMYEGLTYVLEDTYGEATISYLNDEFSNVVKARKGINRVYELAGAEFTARYNAAYLNGATKPELQKIVDDAKKDGFFPVMRLGTDNAAIINRGKLNSEQSLQYSARIGDKAKKTIKAIHKVWAPAHTSAGVNFVHWTDGKIISEDTRGLGIHDAKMLGIGYAVDTAKAYQKAVWKHTVETADPVSEALKIAKKLKDLSEEDTEVVGELTLLANVIKRNKAEIKAMGASIEHMSLPGSMVSVTGQGEVLRNELPSYPTNEDIAKFYKDKLGPTLAVNHNNTAKKLDFYNIEEVFVEDFGEKVTVKTEKGQWTFHKGQAQSAKAVGGKGGFVTALQMKDVHQHLRYLQRLGNEPEMSDIPTGKLMAEAMESTDGMLSLFDKLHQMTGTAVDTHTTKLRELIGSLDTKFLGKMKLYLNDKATRNNGSLSIDARTINLNVHNKPIVGTEMSATEVYAHEVIHAFTAYAEASKDVEAQRVRSRIRQIQEAAKRKINKDSLPEGVWEYIFEGENSLREFVAYATTNEAVMKELSKYTVKENKAELTFLDKVLDLLKQLLDIVTFRGKSVRAGETMTEAMLSLTFNLMEYNNKAVTKIEEKKGAVKFVLSLIENKEAKFKETIDSLLKKMAKEGTPPPVPPKNPTRLELAKWYVEFLPQLLSREDMKPYWKRILSAFKMRPEGFVQNVIRDMSVPDKLERTVEKLGMMSDIVDQKARSMEATVGEAVKRKFTRELTLTEKEVLTEMVVDTDLQSIFEQYGAKKVAGMLVDPKQLKDEIEVVKKQLKGEHYNWYVHSAQGLANYMVTGYAGLTQNLNAENIATGVLTGESIEASPETIKAIDTLATLYALEMSKDGSKGMLADLLSKEEAGVSYVVEMHKLAQEEARAKLFRNNKLMVKGYSKGVFDNTISVVVKPLAQREELEAQGFFLVKPLEKTKSDKTSLPMGVYKSKNFMNVSYYRAATRLTGIAKRGTSVTDLAFMDESNRKLELLLANRSKSLLDKQRMEEVKKIKEGKPSNSSEIVSPVLDEYGNVVDYRYMMSKEEKKQLLVQDTSVDKVIARTHGSIIDKASTAEHNKAVLDVIWNDMKENYVEGSSHGKNNMEYILIEKNSPDKSIAEIYRLLPDEFKHEMAKRDMDYLPVRRDMLLNYFGFRNSTITNLAIGSTPIMTNGQVKAVVRGVEAIWQEFIKIAKVNIVIRIPAVLMGNIMSNIMVSVVEGKNPVQVVRMQLENARWLRQYLNDEAEYRQAQLDKNDKEVRRLRRELERNPVHELMEAGMYQPIIEDIGKADFESSNRVSRWLDKKMEGLPTFVKNGAHWLYLTEKTSFFRFMTQATQYSDFVARATQNQLMKEKGISKEVRMNVVLDAFVNYNKPATSIEEWFNQMGFMMFTKYAKRIQRAIARQIKDHPIKALLYIAGQEYLGIMPEDIYDQSLFTRSWYNIGLNPLDHVIQVASPAGIDLFTGGQLSSPIKFH